MYRYNKDENVDDVKRLAWQKLRQEARSYHITRINPIKVNTKLLNSSIILSFQDSTKVILDNKFIY